MALYDAIDLRLAVEKKINEKFDNASAQLDEIQASEDLKTPLREMLETLNGRKK
jgi:hypothetical protein